MSLDIWLTVVRPVVVHDQNITHNLNRMAEAAGIYRAVWHLDGIKTASDLIPILEKGIADMEQRPEYFSTFNAPNGWGMYEHFLPWLRKLLDACRENPMAEVSVSR